MVLENRYDYYDGEVKDNEHQCFQSPFLGEGAKMHQGGLARKNHGA